jgi:hypothetical protein
VTAQGTNGILYVNGIAVASNAVTVRPFNLGGTLNNYLGRSQWSPDPYLNGVFDEFRIYNIALSAPELAATYTLGPNQLLSTNSPTITLAPTPTNLTLTWPIASAGFTLQSRTNLALGIWQNIPSPVPQIVGTQWQVALPLPGTTSSIFYRLAK